jgi:hypothetical protein
MATYVGCNAKIVIKQNEPSDPPILIGEQNNWSINYSFTSEDFRPLGAYFPNRGISVGEWSLSLSGYFDYLDPGQALARSGTKRYFEIYPVGDDPAEPLIRGLCFISGLDVSGTPDELLPISITATGCSSLQAINTFIGEP